MVGLLYKPTCNLQTNHFLSLFKIDHIIFCGTAWQVFGTLGLMLCCSPAKKNFNFTIPHLFAQCPGLQFFSHDQIDGRLNVPIFLIDVSSGRLLDISMISFEPSWYQMLHLKIAAVNTKGTDKGCECIIILHHYLNILYHITSYYLNLH